MEFKYLQMMGFIVREKNRFYNPVYGLKLTYGEAIYFEHLINDLVRNVRRAERSQIARKIDVRQED